MTVWVSDLNELGEKKRPVVVERRREEVLT